VCAIELAEGERQSERKKKKKDCEKKVRAKTTGMAGLEGRRTGRKRGRGE
jgi:hypothetical protein